MLLRIGLGVVAMLLAGAGSIVGGSLDAVWGDLVGALVGLAIGIALAVVCFAAGDLQPGVEAVSCEGPG